MAAICGVIERVSILAVIATGRGGGLLAQLLLAVSLETCWVHGGWRRSVRAEVTRGRDDALELQMLLWDGGSVQVEAISAQWVAVMVTGGGL